MKIKYEHGKKYNLYLKIQCKYFLDELTISYFKKEWNKIFAQCDSGEALLCNRREASSCIKKPAGGAGFKRGKYENYQNQQCFAFDGFMITNICEQSVRKSWQ